MIYHGVNVGGKIMSENTIGGLSEALTSDLKQLSMRDFLPVKGNVAENVARAVLKELEMSSDEQFMYLWAVTIQKGPSHFEKNPHLQLSAFDTNKNLNSYTI